MGAVPRELLLVAVAMAVLAVGVVLLVTGSTTAGWVLIAVGALIDTVAVARIVRRATGRSRPEAPPMPGMIDGR
ncbi:hypothetical protein [Blastococcus sp. TF02A-26]|uniref:hypothetical protein n=1 Tax=Blastococcus sp. TF02A-26 TaxID=2250577 RepID=UPI000DEB6FB3|nr:hypothetical protein [Blastococcus sp. TF02A-26]RBY85099.1 hypothetical protein DQ240_12755 [Blastococcus sp. TF02A-26]